MKTGSPRERGSAGCKLKDKPIVAPIIESEEEQEWKQKAPMGSSQGCQCWRCPCGAGVGRVRVMPGSKGGRYGHSLFCSYGSERRASCAIKSSTRIFVSSVSWQLAESMKEKGNVCLRGRVR